MAKETVREDEKGRSRTIVILRPRLVLLDLGRQNVRDQIDRATLAIECNCISHSESLRTTLGKTASASARKKVTTQAGAHSNAGAYLCDTVLHNI